MGLAPNQIIVIILLSYAVTALTLTCIVDHIVRTRRRNQNEADARAQALAAELNLISVSSSEADHALAPLPLT